MGGFANFGSDEGAATMKDFFLNCGLFWAFSTSVLLVANGGAFLEWWAPLSVPWKVATVLAPPIGIIGLAAAVEGIFWLVEVPARERSRRARAELDEMRRERERVEAAKAVGEGVP